jgi:hypothetical protein
MTIHINRTLAILFAALAGVAALVIVYLVLDPFGKSVSERVSERVGADMRCSRVGLQVVAGERETVYRCNYRSSQHEGSASTRCFAIISGRVYAVREGC